MENSNNSKQDVDGVVLGQKIVKFRFSRENRTRFEAYPAQAWSLPSWIIQVSKRGQLVACLIGYVLCAQHQAFSEF